MTEGNPLLPTREEHDMLGERELPAQAYYGIHTLRAVENFPIAEMSISDYPELIQSLACIKQAAALSNHELSLLNKTRTETIRLSGYNGITRGYGHPAEGFSSQSHRISGYIKNGTHPASGCCAYGSGTGLRRLRATEVAKLTLRDNRRVYDLVLESGLLSKQQIDEILQPGILTSPRMPLLHP